MLNLHQSIFTSRPSCQELFTESRHVSADLPESRHVSADRPESRHKMATMPEPHRKMAATPDSPAKMAAMPESLAKMATTPEPHHVTAVTKISQIFFFVGGHSTQAPADAELWPGLKRLITCVLDPPLMSVRAADIPVVSSLSSPAGIPLSAALP